MPRDPFYKTRAAEIGANIVLAELEMFRGSVFTSLDSLCTGEVIARTRTGRTLVLEWDVEHQCIRTVDHYADPDAVQLIEVAA